MPKYQDCLITIQKAAGDGTLTDAQAAELLDKVATYADELKNKGSVEDLDSAVLKKGADMANDFQIEAVIAQRSTVINLQRRAALNAVMHMHKNPYVALRAILGGVASLGGQGRLSIDARQKATALRYQKGLLNDLEKKGLVPFFNSGAHDRQIAKELWELSTPGGNPGVSGSAEALEVARVVHAWQRSSVERLNRAGAWVRDLPGYIVRQSHDQRKVLAAGFQQWRDDIAPLLDDMTFEKAGDREAFLKSTYEAIASGEHFRHADGSFDLNEAFGASPSLAKNISRERVLHFKSADDWYNYHEKYGRGELREAVYHGFERSGRQLGLLEVLGTNPHHMFDMLRKDAVKSVREKAVNGDKKAMKALRDLESASLDNLFAEVDGTTRTMVNISQAQVGSIIRGVQTMAKLGASTLASFGDIASIGSELQYQGHGFLKSYLTGMQSLMRGCGDKEQREVARLIGVGSEGMLGSALGRFAVEDGPPGIMSGLIHHYFRWNLQNWWNDSLMTGVGLMMSNDLAENAGRAFVDLRPELRRSLGLYGIDEKNWGVVNKLVWQGDNGYRYVTPDRVQALDDATVRGFIGDQTASDRAISRWKDEFATRLTSYFTDRAFHAVPTPGANERAIWLRGTQPGTAIGEAARFVAQFKMFPTAYLSKLYARETIGRIEGGADRVGVAGFKDGLLNGKGAMWGMIKLMLMTTALGYASMTAKELAKGLAPRDPDKKETWVAAMLQGGGLGIYGDFIFGEYNRMGRSAVASLAGPTLGQLDDATEMWTRFRNGDDTRAQGLKWALSNAPGMNLFYTKAALDYGFLYQLQEALNPGYLERMERRAKEQRGQQFLAPPSQMISYGGGHNKLFER